MPEPQALTFAGLLRQLRAGGRLTQEGLAAAAGLSPRSISDLERGINLTTRRDTARLLADALSLTGVGREEFEAAAALGRVQAARLPAQGVATGGLAGATRTLPRDVGAFTGRVSELTQLVDSVASVAGASGVVSIHAIGGMAGVGKTAFAVHAAHQLAPQFPDGQLFLPLHAHTPGQRPADPADALASLLLTAGVPAGQIPPGLEERSRLWRDRLAGKRLLLVLDDAAGHDQLRPLLPGTAGCLVLVTSRRHLTALEDARAISLDTLPAAEAAELIVRLAGRPGLRPSEAAVAEIARLCGYLPLAIGMLARQLHHHPSWKVAELAAELAAARDRLELMHTENLSVAAAFDLSYADLTPGQQRLFRHLGLQLGPDLDAYAAAALDELDLAGARRGLSALYDHYLIAEPARGRYRLHDLVREHARTLAAADSPADRDAAADRLLGYYLHGARLAGRHLSRRPHAGTADFSGVKPAACPGLSDRHEAMAWMDGERLNLHAAVGYAASHDRPGYAIAVPAAMQGFLRLAGHWDQAIALHSTALEAALRAGDRRAAAGALADLGDNRLATRNYPAAAADLARATELYQGFGDRLGEAHARTEHGAVLYLSGDYPAAAACLHRALRLYHDCADRLGEANVRRRLASVQLVTGDYPAATAGLTRALELYRALGDRLGEAHALNDLGAVQEATGDYAAATSSQEQALALYRALGDRLGEAHALSDLTTVRQATGDYETASASVRRALALYQELADRLGKANAVNQLGAIQQATGEYAAAALSQEQALELYRELGDRAGEAEALITMAEISLARADPAQACASYEQARAIAADLASPLVQARALEGIGRCGIAGDQPGEGAEALRLALAIYQRIGSPSAERVRKLLAG